MHDNKLQNQAIELIATDLATDYPSYNKMGGPQTVGQAGRRSQEMGMDGNDSGTSATENILS